MANLTPLTTPNDVSPDIASQISTINANVAKLNNQQDNTNPAVPPTTPAPVTPVSQATMPQTTAPAIKPAPNPAANPPVLPGSSVNTPPYVGAPVIAYNSQGQPVYTQTPANTTTNVTANGSTGNADVDALEASYKAQADAAKTFATAVSNIENGATPLNAGEQAQIDGLKQQYEQLINTQNLVNTNNTGTAQVRGFQTGVAEFDRGFQANTIGSIISAGATKIANLQTQEASAVAALTQSLQSNDIANLKTVYQSLTDAQTATQNGLKEVIADTQSAFKDSAVQQVISSGITDPKDILSTLKANGYTDISSSDIASTIKNLSPDAADIYSTAQNAVTDGASADTVALIMKAPDKQTALNILAQSGVANSAVNTMMAKYPDAGIVPGDTVEQANAKVQASPSYTMAQKSAALDLVAKQANIDKTFADIAAETVSPEDATAFLNDLPDYNGTSYVTPTQLTGLSTKEKSAYMNAAQQAGIPILSAKDADALSAVSAAQADLQSFQSFIASGSLLPTSWLDQPAQYADVTLNKFLSTNNALSAFNTWEASALPLLQGLKGAGSGGGGASRLLSTATEWLPKDTDTLAQAKLKIDHLMTLLNNGANSIIPPKNTSTYSGVTLPGGGDSTSTAPSYNGVTLPN